MSKTTLFLLSCLFALVLVSGDLIAQSTTLTGSWPHWMGPDRNNTWNESGLIDKFPEGGPAIAWRTKIGSGYSGPAIANGKVIISDFVTNDDFTQSNFQRLKMKGTERVLCLDEKTGKEIWKHEVDLVYAISYPAGPRCTPVIEGDRVYTLGAEGNLYCFNLETGDVIWSKELKKEYKTNSALWGYAGHPLIDGDNLITLAGGRGSHVVALNKNDGTEVWRSSTSKETGYSPPTIINASGVRQLILLRPDAVSSVNPDTGSEYWSVPYEATSNSIIMSPVCFDNYVYAAGYSRKSLMIELGKDAPTAKELWRNKGRDAISPVNVQPYFDKKTNVLYGMDHNGEMRATQLPEGKLLWKTTEPIPGRRAGNGTAFIVRQGDSDRYWLFNDVGELVIAEMTPKGYQGIDRAKVIEPTNRAFNRPVVWSMPAFANRRAYIRNDKEIICVELGKSE
ncbi:MAG: PQQ-binding-like beta-propeller repeat protein [Planctomycetota bacterium]